MRRSTASPGSVLRLEFSIFISSLSSRPHHEIRRKLSRRRRDGLPRLERDRCRAGTTEHARGHQGARQDFGWREVRHTPFGFLDEKNEPVGFDLDLVRKIAEKLGVGVEFVKVTSPTRIPLLVSGNVDLVAASMTDTPEREKTIDFSITYYTGGQSLLVPAESKISRPRGPRRQGGRRAAGDDAREEHRGGRAER